MNRDLDHKVAEKIFGWKWATFIGNAYLLHPSQHEDNLRPGLSWKDGIHGKKALTHEHFFDSSRPYDRFMRLPEYSTKVQDTFMVIELMKRRGYAVSIFSPKALIDDEMSTYSKRWTVCFQWWRVGETDPEEWPNPYASSGEGSTFQEATCNAAVKMFK